MVDGPAVSEPAPAKLNVFLRVRGLRADGFHDVESLVQPLTLADGVQARPADGELRLTVVGECAADVPRSDDNLVVRAARALAEVAGDRGANLLLQKRIPVTAGLGGGSADAAAALRALDRLWGCGMSTSRLGEIGASVGSDVPALLHGRPVVVRGRGEHVAPVEVPRTWWVLVTPAFDVRAADAYRWWDEDGGRPGPDPGPLLAALEAGDLVGVGGLLFNDLEGPVSARHPEVTEANKRLLGSGALGAVMCGSGPTVAGLARDGYHAEEIASAVDGLAVGSIVRVLR